MGFFDFLFGGVSPSDGVCRGKMPHEFEASHEGEVVTTMYRGHPHLTDWGWSLAKQFAELAADQVYFPEKEVRSLQSYLRSPEKPEVEELLVVLYHKSSSPHFFPPTWREDAVRIHRALYRAASKTLRGLSREDALLVLGWAIRLGPEETEKCWERARARVRILEGR